MTSETPGTIPPATDADRAIDLNALWNDRHDYMPPEVQAVIRLAADYKRRLVEVEAELTSIKQFMEPAAQIGGRREI